MFFSTENLIHGRFIFLLCLLLILFWGSGVRAQESSDFLTDPEQKWLDEHPVLRLGVGIAFPPFMWVQEKNGRQMFMGMVSDYVDLLGEKMGVNMEIVFGIPFGEALARGRDGRIDFFPCLSSTPERSEFLLFTQPYLSYPLVVMTREDAPFIGGVRELEGKRFAVVKRLVVYSKIKTEYPNLHLNYVFTRKVEENLEAVSMGRADACIINLAVASYYIQKKGLANLRIAAPVNWEDVQFAMAVRKDWPILQGIIKKALTTISREEKDRISQRWIRAEYEPGVAIDRIWRWSLWIGLGLAVLFGLFFIWNRRLRKEIAEKEKAEYALKKSERKLSTLIGNLPGMVYRCSNDRDWTMSYLSDGCKALTGYNPSELIDNRALSYNDLIVREDRRRLWNSVQTALDGNRSFTVEYRIQTKTGNERWVWERGFCVAGFKGDDMVLEGFISDITEKRQLQTQLQQTQKMETIGLMAGGVAHDLNNILSGIVSYPELLLMDLPEESPLRKPIKTIQESGMRAADVVADLLTVARGVAIAKEVFNLNPMIEGYLNSAEHQKLAATHPSVIFKTEIDPDLLNISCSPTHIKKTLMNLVINASEAIEGSGAVVISTSNQYLDEPLKGYRDVRVGEYAVLTVSDDGSGISPEDLERIFEPFYTKKVMGRSGKGC
jgi:PAS domain S-box-containing protein